MKKLNTEQVYEIKKLIKEENTAQKEIAKMFNVAPSTISKIKRGHTFNYIVVPSEEYQKGYEEGYDKGFQDGKKFMEISTRPIGESENDV